MVFSNILKDRMEVQRLRDEIAATERRIQEAQIATSVEQSLTIIYQNRLHPSVVPTRAYSELAARSSDLEA